jgi:2-iminobutanoate/2-iminopropanoate deaminase
MTRRALQPEGLVTPKAPYSPVVVDGDLVLTAGQVGFDENGDLVEGGIGPQTRRALDNVGACLAAAGCGFEDVLKVNAYLADLGEFDGYNAVYREYFAEPYPVRTTVGVSLPGGILVEIEAVARVRA